MPEIYWSRRFALLLITLLLFRQQTAPVADPTLYLPLIMRPAPALVHACAPASLTQLVDCLVAGLAPARSNGFVVPDDSQRSDFYTTTMSMLQGACDPAALPPALAGSYALGRFDDPSDGKPYCVLAEQGDANQDGQLDHGWGLFVVALAPQRDLHIDAPHTWTDADTEHQAVQVFQAVGARSLMIAGARRDANQAASTCNANYYVSDAAHNQAHPFQAAAEAVLDFYANEGRPYTTLQFHGLSASICPKIDVFMTCGIDQPAAAGSSLQRLQSALQAQQPTWRVFAPGQAGDCDYGGWSNTEGRLLNGAPRLTVCQSSLAACSGRFIHIEQHPGFRSAQDWVQAIQDVFP